MTALAARASLGSALRAALPSLTVLDTPGAALTGPGIVLHPGGWSSRNGFEVVYQVDVSVLGLSQDPTQAQVDVEQNTATAFLAAIAAGWSIGPVSGIESVTYMQSDLIGCSFTASKIAQLT